MCYPVKCPKFVDKTPSNYFSFFSTLCIVVECTCPNSVSPHVGVLLCATAQSGLIKAFMKPFPMVSWYLLELCLNFITPPWPCLAAGHSAAPVHPRGGAEAVGPGEGRVQRPGHLAGHRGGEWGGHWPRATAQAVVLPWRSTKVMTTAGLPAASHTNPCTDIALQRQFFQVWEVTMHATASAAEQSCSENT